MILLTSVRAKQDEKFSVLSRPGTNRMEYDYDDELTVISVMYV